MGRLSLLSVGLFVLPIAITVGVLVGFESYSTSRGQVGLKPGVDNGIQVNTYCQKAFGIHPNPQTYTFNPNQWGTTDALGPGNQLCMNITTFNNATYPGNDTAPTFTATWEYPQGPVEEPVHAFPNAKLDLVTDDPVRLNEISAFDLNMRWTYGVGAKIANETDSNALDVVSMNANVCIDAFFDGEAGNSGVTNASAYEVMVWYGRWGTSTQPIGMLQGALVTYVLNDIEFDLYYGPNGIGQKVFTWVARGNTTSFAGDIAPLFTTLYDHGGPSATDYLGYIAFGTEALWTAAEVTFSVPELKMDITKISSSTV